MQTITILRKSLTEGYLSTYRFGVTADGRFVAKSNTGKVKDFATRYALERAIEAFIGLGYTTRVAPAAPVKKQEVQQEELNIAPYW